MGGHGNHPVTAVKMWAVLSWKGHKSWKDHMEKSGLCEGEISEFTLTV